MPPLQNQRYEEFATAVAGGTHPNVAAQVAGIQGRNAGQDLLEGPFGRNIRNRISEIQSKRGGFAPPPIATDDTAVEDMDRNWVMTQLQKTYKAAKGESQFKPAIEALRLIGMEQGMFVQRRELTLKKIDEMSTAELKGLLSDLEVDYEDITDRQALPPPKGFTDE